MATVATTAATAMTMPSMARSERSLFLRSARSAVRSEARRFMPAANPPAGDAPPQTGVVAEHQRRRLKVTMRRACSAMSGSWVTSTTVRPCVVELLEDAHHLHAVSRVEVAGGLVGEQERGPVDQRAGDGHALLLAAGELRGV